jgi:hypothetical protein
VRFVFDPTQYPEFVARHEGLLDCVEIEHDWASWFPFRDAVRIGVKLVRFVSIPRLRGQFTSQEQRQFADSTGTTAATTAAILSREECLYVIQFDSDASGIPARAGGSSSVQGVPLPNIAHHVRVRHLLTVQSGGDSVKDVGHDLVQSVWV